MSERSLQADPSLAGIGAVTAIGTVAAISFSFDGEEVTALPGQTIAAALLASGRRALRTTRLGERPRGLFCGIGACHDCLVVVNGQLGTRACLAPVAAGDVVETQHGA